MWTFCFATALVGDIVFTVSPQSKSIVDPLTPIEETVRAMNHVIDQGKAFYWGTSEWSADDIAAAHGVAARLGLIPPLMEQPQYNLVCRKRFEVEYASLYSQFGMGLNNSSLRFSFPAWYRNHHLVSTCWRTSDRKIHCWSHP